MATQEEKIRFTFETKDDASKKNDKIALSIIAINQALGIAREAARALKKAWDFTKEGAEIIRTEEKFGRLSETIGVTADVLARDLQDAMGGVISKAEAMELGTNLMSLGLAKTKDEAIRLSTVAAQLGMNMNQLVLTLTNQTTMRFDALGVAVDGFDEKVQILKESGMAADEAFKLAFIEQAEEQVKKVGDVAETTAGKLMILEAATKDFKDELKKMAAETFAPAAVAMTDYLKVVEFLKDAHDQGYISTGQYRAQILALNTVLPSNHDLLRETADRMQTVAERNEMLAGMPPISLASKLGIDELNDGLSESITKMSDWGKAAIAAAVQSTIWQQISKDGFISQQEVDLLTTASQVVGADIPEDLDFMVDTFNTMQGDVIDDITEVERYLQQLTGRSWVIGLSINVPQLPSGKDISGRTSSQGGYTGQDWTIPDWAGAAGGSFTVPSGYPNDSFRMNVESGEHVKVTPAGQSGNADVVAAIKELKDEMYRINKELVTAHS